LIYRRERFKKQESAMATRALTPFAQRQRRVNVSVRIAPGRRRDWRQVLLSHDAEAIWQELSILVKSTEVDPSTGYEHVTQELFLRLLTTDRFSFYLKQDYSDSEIREDLISILSE
jgi:hypothetical protein